MTDLRNLENIFLKNEYKYFRGIIFVPCVKRRKF